DDSGREDSFVIDGLGAPHYTRPQNWRGMEVPSVLISGHHANVRAWRRQQARLTTEQFRPELLSSAADDSSGGSHPAPATVSDSPATGRSHDQDTREENDHG
ncbi:MAG: hypothetical protein GF341_09150, partial [candidate division Zixibacteria bacterium]|nr:hypothetical protein [candidate division Zixibacteria bacterium]